MLKHKRLIFRIVFAGLLCLLYKQISLRYKQHISTVSLSIHRQDLPRIIQKEVALLPCNCHRTLHVNVTSNNNTSSDRQSNSPVSSCSDWATARGPGQRVVSYAVYGTFPGEYYDGLVKQITRVKVVYPGWILRLYLDLSKPNVQEWACSLACQNQHFDLCDVNNLPELGNISTYFGMTWRFAVVGDPLVERYMVRDADCPIIQRELDAVDEWLHSGKCFHGMRDHPFHGAAIMGGMWGGCNTWKLSTFQEIRKKLLVTSTTKVGKDQSVLQKHLWPEIKKNVLMHASYLCKMFPGSSAYPTKRENLTFVGMASYRKKYMNDDKVNKPCPKECRPPDHQDWEYC